MVYEDDFIYSAIFGFVALDAIAITKGRDGLVLQGDYLLLNIVSYLTSKL